MRRMISMMLVGVTCAALSACQNMPASPTTLGGSANGGASTMSMSDPGASTMAPPTTPGERRKDRRGHGKEEQLEGLIEALPPATPALTLTVAGVTVVTNAETKFYLRGGAVTFAALELGQRVHVKGTTTDAGLLAAVVTVQNTNVGVGSIEFTAVIASKSGTNPNLTLLIGTYTVTTNANTSVRRKGDEQAPSALQVGMTVTVVGQLQTDGSVIAKAIHIEGDAVGGLFEMEGSVGNLTGTCATSVSFKVSGYQITTNALTVFVPNCAALSNGSKVIVNGTVQAGGSILATRVEKK